MNNNKEKIQFNNSRLQNIDAFIDWGYIKSDRGLKKINNVIQIIIGRVLFWVSILFMLGSVITEFSSGNGFSKIIKAEGLGSIIFSSSILIFSYSIYLLRNRALFLDRKIDNNLYLLKNKLTKNVSVSKLDITEFFTHRAIFILNYCINKSDDNNFAQDFIKKLSISKSLKLSRLGLNNEQLFDPEVLAEINNKTAYEFFKELIIKSFEFSFENELKQINIDALFYVLISEYYSKALIKYNILQKDIEGLKLWLRNDALSLKYKSTFLTRPGLKNKSVVNKSYTSRYTTVLNQYSNDFSSEVASGKFIMSVARESELEKMIMMLEKGEKSAVLLLGEPGVGKTTLVRSLAVKIAVEDVPRKLIDKRLVGFDFNKAFTAVSNPDEFKSLIRKVFEETALSSNVILVLDNIHQLLNLRSEITGEIVNIIVDSIDKYNIRILATTDRTQYARFFRPYKSLSSLFSEVEMAVPSDPVAIQIVFDEVPRIEKESQVAISYQAVKASVELSHRFSYDRVLPDKALDLLSETVVKFKNYANVRPIGGEEVAQVVSSKVGVNLGSISEDESKKLSNLEEIMHKRVIGQNEAIDAVADALRRSRTGLSSGGKPTASFLFFGPTGVGKTEVAKTVAETYFGHEDKIVRIDMSEFHEEENLKRLIGHYSDKGSFEGGYLTEQVFSNPFSVVLLDEIDKANPKVLDLFLQLLDEGYIVDGLGRKVIFTNTIVIATSNAGSMVIAKAIEQGKSYRQVLIEGMEELKRIFRIEFINRFDKVIMFRPLTKEEIKQVAKKFVEQVRKKLLDKGYKFVYNDMLLTRLAQIGYNPVFGAREMRRIVQDEVENKVADMIVRGEARVGEEIVIN